VYQPEAANTPLDRATHEFVNSLHQSNPGLRQIGNDENMRVNGVAAKSVELIGTSPVHDAQGQVVRERDWLVTVEKRDGSLLYMVFISPEPEFAVLRPGFEQMVRSMKLK
jgi:beta-barrel assembly-enhancing protease